MSEFDDLSQPTDPKLTLEQYTEALKNLTDNRPGIWAERPPKCRGSREIGLLHLTADMEPQTLGSWRCPKCGYLTFPYDGNAPLCHGTRGTVIHDPWPMVAQGVVWVCEMCNSTWSRQAIYKEPDTQSWLDAVTAGLSLEETREALLKPAHRNDLQPRTIMGLIPGEDEEMVKIRSRIDDDRTWARIQLGITEGLSLAGHRMTRWQRIRNWRALRRYDNRLDKFVRQMRADQDADLQQKRKELR